MVVQIRFPDSVRRALWCAAVAAFLQTASPVVAQEPEPTPSAELTQLQQINAAQAQQTRWLAFIAGGVLFVGVISKWRL